MLAPNSEPKSMLPLKRKNQLSVNPLVPNWVRGVQGGSKNQSKIYQKRDFNMGRHLGIDFRTILVDFGKQVGFENRTKIDPKRHRKSDEKKKVPKMAKKSQ